jgi:hypothetical protein
MIDVIEKEKDLAIQLILVWGIIVLLTMIFFEVSDMAEITYLPVGDVNLETVNPSLIIPDFVVE